MNEISLSSIISIILHRIWIVILVTVLCAALAFGYCQFLATPVYRAHTSIIVTNGGIIVDDSDNSVKSTDLAASLYLVDTCIDILNTSQIYQDLSNSLQNKYNYKQLKAGFSVAKRSDNSLFIDVYFRSTNASEAIVIANAFTELCPGYINQRIPSIKISIGDISDSASMVYPNTITSSILFSFLGAAVTCVLIVLFAAVDQTIKSEDDFISSFDIPVLGTVPDFENSPTYAYRSKTGNSLTGG